MSALYVMSVHAIQALCGSERNDGSVWTEAAYRLRNTHGERYICEITLCYSTQGQPIAVPFIISHVSHRSYI